MVSFQRSMECRLRQRVLEHAQVGIEPVRRAVVSLVTWWPSEPLCLLGCVGLACTAPHRAMQPPLLIISSMGQPLGEPVGKTGLIGMKVCLQIAMAAEADSGRVAPSMAQVTGPEEV